jgi:hypothetical protein
MQNMHTSIQSIQCLESKCDLSVGSHVVNMVSDGFCLRVIDGADTTLDSIEKVPVDEKYRPKQEIRVRSVTIHANPIADRDA